MDLKDILTIAGKPGLFKSVAQSKNGFIVESLLDGKRFQAFTTEKISSLSEISVFTKDEDKPLVDVFRQMKDKEAEITVPEAKTDDSSIKKYFESILPEYDRERFYVSHMRKILNWYNLLASKEILDFTPIIQEDSSTDNPETNES